VCVCLCECLEALCLLCMCVFVTMTDSGTEIEELEKQECVKATERGTHCNFRY